jgi:hypothetical protein
MQAKTRETLRWIYLVCYVGLSMSIYISHLIQTSTPLALVIFVVLNCLILVAFKLTEKKSEEQNK